MPEKTLPNIGGIVRFTRKTTRTGTLVSEQRIGRVTCVWSMDGGGEIAVDTDNGSFHPSLGDTWEQVEEA